MHTFTYCTCITKRLRMTTLHGTKFCQISNMITAVSVQYYKSFSNHLIKPKPNKAKGQLCPMSASWVIL